jgi:murein DD-endopeptidase MepM/ murein hydrolase activator NlpD
MQGGVIGAIGSTGNADGAHLHFEMMFGGARVNPHDYIR